MNSKFKEFYNSKVFEKDELTRQERINVIKNTENLFQEKCKLRFAIISWKGRYARPPYELFVPYERQADIFPHKYESSFYDPYGYIHQIYASTELDLNRGDRLIRATKYAKDYPELFTHILYRITPNEWCSPLTYNELVLKVDELFPIPF